MDNEIKFETATLAREKGFDKIQRNGMDALLYDMDGNHVEYANYGFQYSGLSKGYISGPTQTYLQKWLREFHNIDVEPYLVLLKSNDREIEQKIENKEYHVVLRIVGLTFPIHDDAFPTWEEALEHGLVKALEQI